MVTLVNRNLVYLLQYTVGIPTHFIYNVIVLYYNIVLTIISIQNKKV